MIILIAIDHGNKFEQKLKIKLYARCQACLPVLIP